MKIQLERKSPPCPDKLLCTVCGQIFAASSIRSMLYNRHNLLQGDVCADCMRLSHHQFRQKIRDRGNLLLKLSEIATQTQTAQRIRALELLEVAKEAVHFPAPYQWWWKRLETISDEAQALEKARMGINPRDCETRSRLEKLLVHDQGVN